MTPVITTNDTTISTADITWNHVVVAIINEKPCLLGKGYDEPAEKLSFRIIGSDDKEADTATGTFGNGWDFNNKANTPQLMVEQALNLKHKVAVFESEHWRQALQWLIDNSFNF